MRRDSLRDRLIRETEDFLNTELEGGKRVFKKKEQEISRRGFFAALATIIASSISRSSRNSGKR